MDSLIGGQSANTAHEIVDKEEKEIMQSDTDAYWDEKEEQKEIEKTVSGDVNPAEKR